MKYICHRANIDGPNPETENSPDQVSFCLDNGYDVEIDVRYDSLTDELWLGHDNPQYIISWSWLEEKKDYLWIHCKNISALHEFSSRKCGYNYFWHQEDDYTLTSREYIWAYPGKVYTKNTVIVMPEWKEVDWKVLKNSGCFGICTDYVEKLQ